MAQAFTGVLASNGGGLSHPRPIGFTFSDVVGGDYFYSCILAALLARERTGKGTHVICSQTGATLYFQRTELSTTLGNFGGDQPDDGKHAWQRMAFQQVIKASDGRDIVVSFTKKDQLKRCVDDTFGIPEVLTPTMLSRWPVAGPEDRKNLTSGLARVAATKSSQYWLDRLVANKVPCAPLNNYADLADKGTSTSQHLYANNYMVDINHRDYGQLQVVGNPVTFTATPSDSHSSGDSWHAPYIGEHTDEMLKTLGFSDVEASKLVSEGVVPKPIGGFTRENSRKGAAGYAKKMAEVREEYVAKRNAGKSKL
jgi:crotonobetainyl-CoA:carnitine CoA-transferase CaiB-like acyl-CoA transferase